MKTTAALIGFLLAGLPMQAATIVVTTADNASTAGDGMTSLVEALTSLADGDIINFNIPGPGPHYLITPVAGYPLIAKNGVVIDGYSQPGAAPNTAGLRQPNNAALRIVLDSRTEIPGERRTVIDYPGFGTSESCVLGLMDAKGVRIRGLAFIGVAGAGSDEDPSVYNIALIKESQGVKVQGCWFGLDPARSGWAPGPDGVVPGIHGARSAIASFKWEGLSSIGLIFGTDGDGTADTGEFNLCVAQRLAVHLQTPAVRVSGNWFNFLPDGSVWDPVAQGVTLEDGTMEAIENGDGTGMMIGTDGNGTSDEDEGNIFGPIVYDVLVEFWRSAPGIVFAGNSFGVGLDGFPAFTGPGHGLVSIRKDSGIRIGSDFNGTGDAAEANHLHGLGSSFIAWHNSNNDGGAKVARISLRGNELIANYGGIPLDSGVSVSPDRAYEGIMADPFSPAVTLDPASTVNLLVGTAPVAVSGADPEVTGPVIDVYLADAFGLYATPTAPQGRSYLGSFLMDGPLDLDPAAGKFSFNVSAFALTAAELGRVTVTANYLEGVTPVTTSFSATLAAAVAPPPFADLTIAKSGANVQLQWTGGTAPFRIRTAATPAGPWSDLSTTAGQSFITPVSGASRFYRVFEGAPPR